MIKGELGYMERKPEVSDNVLDSADVYQEGLITDERMLNRDEVLELCFTSRDTVTGKPINDRRVKIARAPDAIWIAPGSALIGPQTREKYNWNHLTGIGRDICTSAHGQLQNGAVGLHDVDHVEQYVSDLNDQFESDLRVDDIPYHQKFGGFMLTIFGHNRQLGIAAHNLYTYGNPNHGKAFEAKLIVNPRFSDALEMQAKENNGMGVPAWVRARHMVNFKRLRLRDGDPVTNDQIAEIWGVDRDQVWRSEVFLELPDPIKLFAERDQLSLSAAIELEQMRGFYDDTEVCALAEQLVKAGHTTVERVRNAVKLRLAVTGLSPEILLMVEKNELRLTQARELQRFNSIKPTRERLNEVATWITLKNLDAKQSEEYISRQIKLESGNTSSIFDKATDTTITFEERQLLIEGEKNSIIKNKAAETIRRTKAALDSLSNTLQSGVVTADELVDSPIAQMVGQEMGDILQKIAAGEIQDIDPGLLESAQKLLEAEQDVLNGTVAEQIREAAQRLLEYAIITEEPQEALF